MAGWTKKQSGGKRQSATPSSCNAESQHAAGERARVSEIRGVWPQFTETCPESNSITNGGEKKEKRKKESELVFLVWSRLIRLLKGQSVQFQSLLTFHSELCERSSELSVFVKRWRGIKARAPHHNFISPRWSRVCRLITPCDISDAFCLPMIKDGSRSRCFFFFVCILFVYVICVLAAITGYLISHRRKQSHTKLHEYKIISVLKSKCFFFWEMDAAWCSYFLSV